MKLKVLQWNSWYKEKIDNIRKTIREIDADIICLQELTTNSEYNPQIDEALYLAEQLNLHYYFEPAQSWKSRIQGNGIFSKFPIKSTTHTILTPPSKDPLHFHNEGRVYVEVLVALGNKDLIVATTHLSYTNRFYTNEHKRREVNNLLSVMKQKSNKAYLFTADLNTRPNGYAVKEIGKILTPAGPEYTENTWTTKPFEYEGFKVNDLRFRLDYVFVSESVEIKNATIVQTKHSDHLPILVEINF